MSRRPVARRRIRGGSQRWALFGTRGRKASFAAGHGGLPDWQSVSSAKPEIRMGSPVPSSTNSGLPAQGPGGWALGSVKERGRGTASGGSGYRRARGPCGTSRTAAAAATPSHRTCATRPTARSPRARDTRDPSRTWSPGKRWPSAAPSGAPAIVSGGRRRRRTVEVPGEVKRDPWGKSSLKPGSGASPRRSAELAAWAHR
jgi:hypothetical protein